MSDPSSCLLFAANISDCGIFVTSHLQSLAVARHDPIWLNRRINL